MQQGAIIRPATLRHDTTTLPAKAMARPARAQGRQAVRPSGLASEVCHDTNGCIVTGGAGPVLRHSATVRHDTTQGVATSATSRATRRAIHARHARGLGALRAPPGSGCALYTRTSVDSVHCLQSLFGSLFMVTVHEHSSRGLKYIYIYIYIYIYKLNEIK